MTTGSGRFFSNSLVLELNALQKSIKFTPCCPKAGPTGGLGEAAPAGTCNLMYVIIFFSAIFILFQFEKNPIQQEWIFQRSLQQL